MFPMPIWVSVACEGAGLAVLIRWVFQLDVEMHWAVAIGILSRFFGVWLLEQLVSQAAVHSLATSVMTVSAIAAVLGVTQLVRGR
jgi:hypothetical protein